MCVDYMKKALFIKIDSVEFIIRKNQIIYVGKLSLVECNSFCYVPSHSLDNDNDDNAKAGKSLIDIFPLVTNKIHTRILSARCDDNACRTN